MSHKYNGKATQSIHSYQSGWMDHWKGTQDVKAADMHSFVSWTSGNSLDDHGAEKQPLSKASGIASATSIRDLCLLPEQKPAEQVKYHMFFGESSYSCSRPKETLTGLGSHVFPNRFDHEEYTLGSDRATVRFLMHNSGVNPVRSILASKEQASKTNLTVLDQECGDYRSHSAFYVGKMNNWTKCEMSVSPYLKNKTKALLGNDLEMNAHHSAVFGKDQNQRMLNHFSVGQFASQSFPPEMARSQASIYQQVSHSSIPHFVHDVEAMRTCTSLDSMERLKKSRPILSQMLITETDVKLYKEHLLLGKSKVSDEVREDKCSEVHATSPLLGHAQGVKLQLLCSSTGSDDEESAKDVKPTGVPQKNELSHETDTMDIEYVQRNRLLGVDSSPPNEDIIKSELDRNPQATMALTTEGSILKRQTSEIPDINLEVLTHTSASTSMEKAEPSVSRTQSLDMDALGFHTDQTSESKLNPFPETLFGPESGSWWIKRLKLGNSSPVAIGSKSSNPNQPLSDGKVTEYLRKIMKGNPNVSETQISESSDKKPRMVDRTTDDLSSVKTGKEGEKIMLSHAWIQRWQHDPRQRKPKSVVTCEPDSSKLTPEDLQSRQFPSIAAMALMGQAMTEPQCEIQKRGSISVWNSKSPRKRKSRRKSNLWV